MNKNALVKLYLQIVNITKLAIKRKLIMVWNIAINVTTMSYCSLVLSIE